MATEIFRAVSGLELIEREDQRPKMSGLFAPFNQWAEIDSIYEGHFVEKIAPGAFTKTFAENLPNVRVIFSHGKDPSIGYKVLGKIEAVRETDDGAAYDVSLLDAPYVNDLLPGLRAGLYGSSFTADVVKMDENYRAQRSEFNQGGLPERTYTEMRLKEFGPTPFPQYKQGTTPIIRSVTDEVVFAGLLKHPDQVRKLLEDGAVALDRQEEPEQSTPPEESRRTQEEAEPREEDQPTWLLK